MADIKYPCTRANEPGAKQQNVFDRPMNHKIKPLRRKVKRRINANKLPQPIIYYCDYFQLVKISSEWISVNCCFHADSHPSLRLNLTTGAFRCFGCGVKGRDIISFHQQRFQLSFIEAVSFFGAWDE